MKAVGGRANDKSAAKSQGRSPSQSQLQSASHVQPQSQVQSQSQVQVIARAAAILRALEDEAAGLSLGQIAHPEWVDGRRLWRDGSVEDIVRRIQQGDPTKGWEGDPRLEIYYDAPRRRWELWRLEHDNQYRRVLFSDPGAPLDASVIDFLIKHDRNRGYDVHKEVLTVNQGVRNRRSKDYQDWLHNEMAPRIAHAASKGRIHDT